MKAIVKSLANHKRESTSKQWHLTKVILSLACLIALSTSTAAKAATGQAFGLKSKIQEFVPTLEGEELVNESRGDPATFKTTLKVTAAGSTLVLKATTTDTMADTGSVNSSTQTALVGPVNQSLNLGPVSVPNGPTIELNAGGFSVAAVHSKTTIASSKVDSESILENLNLSLIDPTTGQEIVNISATGLRTVASAACPGGTSGSVTADTFRVFVAGVQDVDGTSGPLTPRDITIPGFGYVRLSEKINTPGGNGITVNAVHIFYEDEANGTFVEIVVGSATASCQ